MFGIVAILQNLTQCMFREKSYSLPALVFMLTAAILWCRGPDRLAHGFLWAEDASVFLAQAGLPLRAAIGSDYAGYLHMIPRVIAWLQSRTGAIQGAPYFFVWSALLVTATSSAYIAAALRAIPVPARIAMALAPVASPQNGEVLLTITNLQWLLFSCLLVLLWECLFDPPENGYAPRVAATVALTLTGPFGVLVAPAVAGIVLVRRRFDLRQIAWLAAYGGAVAAQAYVMVKHSVPHEPTGHVAWTARVLREMFCDLLPGRAPLWAGAALAVLLGYAVLSSRSALIGTLLCGVGVAVWVLAVVRVNAGAPALIWRGGGSRYLYLPLLLFLWASILAVATARSRSGAAAGMLLATVVLSASLTQFEVMQTDTWRIREIQTGYEVSVPPGWTINVRAN